MPGPDVGITLVGGKLACQKTCQKGCTAVLKKVRSSQSLLDLQQEDPFVADDWVGRGVFSEGGKGVRVGWGMESWA